jgi:hypothetical protein
MILACDVLRSGRPSRSYGLFETSALPRNTGVSFGSNADIVVRAVPPKEKVLYVSWAILSAHADDPVPVAAQREEINQRASVRFLRHHDHEPTKLIFCALISPLIPLPQHSLAPVRHELRVPEHSKVAKRRPRPMLVKKREQPLQVLLLLRSPNQRRRRRSHSKAATAEYPMTHCQSFAKGALPCAAILAHFRQKQKNCRMISV